MTINLKKIAVAAALAVVAPMMAAPASASTININVVETGSGIELTGSGSVDLTGLTLAFDNISNIGSFVNPAEGGFGFDSGGLMDFYTTAPQAIFGPGGLIFVSDVGTGDNFGVAFSGFTAGFIVPSDYQSNDPLQFSLFIAGETLASLGIAAIDVAETLGNNTISITFTEVPLPAAAPFLLTGIAGLIAVRRRKRA